jgi:hypothetical protein
MKKKIIIVLLLCIATISCDPAVYLDFYIKNNCNEQIVIDATMGTWSSARQHIIDTIEPDSKAYIYQDVNILGFDRGDISVIIQEMKITKNGYDILHDPSDTTRWGFAYVAKRVYETILTVNDEDFDDNITMQANIYNE